MKFFNRLLGNYTNNDFHYTAEVRKSCKKSITLLESIFGFSIRNKNYFIKALTHSSYLELHPEFQKSNERLEFLGDSILNMIVGKFLFKNYSNENEGFLTKVRASLVNRERLYLSAEEINLQEILLFNEKYLRDSREGLQTILADCLEAVIGAIYLDRGLKYAEKFVLEKIIKPFEENDLFLVDTNYKGQLLEFTHAQKFSAPKYVLVNEIGPPHKKEFTVEVYVGDEILGTGMGKNKKSAEQEAAQAAIQKLKSLPKEKQI